MKITALETIQLAEYPNILWVRVHTDQGLVGLGETFLAVAPVAAHIHETCAPLLLGKDPLRIDAISRMLLNTTLGFRATGAEIRAASAIDIALWDLLGKVTGQPVYQLLGGRSRDAIRVYNTCAGYRYIRSDPVQSTTNWGLGKVSTRERPYEDLEGFLHNAGDLARSLLDEGYGGMKIWPFDAYAEKSGGLRIERDELASALEPFEKIRKAVGSRIEIHVEFHSLWNLPTALKIARALEPYDPYWFEDPIKMDNLDNLAVYAARTPVWVTASETLSGRAAFRDLMEKHAVSVVMLDVMWCGGLSEAKKIAALAETHALPVAAHDCTGPVGLAAAVHFSLNAPNALVQEMVRAFYFDWYRDLVTQLPPLAAGHMDAPPGPGLGTELLPDVPRRADATVRVSKL